MTSALRYLGCGPAFPMLPTSGGRLSYLAGPDRVQQSILLILMTEPGERVLRPSFGCGLRRYLLQPNTVTTRALIQQDVERALKLWEPRIRLIAVQVVPGESATTLLIDISYAHVPAGNPGRLVVPLALE